MNQLVLAALTVWTCLTPTRAESAEPVGPLTGPYTSLPKEFLTTPLSLALAAAKVRVAATVVTPAPLSCADPELERCLAQESGYLLRVVGPQTFRESVSAALGALNYRTAASNAMYDELIPRAFDAPLDEIDIFLDGKFGQWMNSWLADWDLERRIQAARFEDLAKAESSKRDAVARKQALLDQASQLESEAMSLDASIADVDREIANVGALNPSAFGKMITSAPAKKKPQTVKYRPEDDFFLPVLKEQLDLVDESHGWLSRKDTASPYLHAELIKALDDFFKNESATLRSLGVPPLVVSVARTPYNQKAINDSGQFSAKMFSSGHVFGMAVDLASREAVRKNWSKLHDLLAQYGLLLLPSLRKADPNHVFLSKFVTDSAFGLRHRITMLRAYKQAISAEILLNQSVRAAQERQLRDVASASVALERTLADIAKQVEALSRQNSARREQLDAKNRTLMAMRHYLAALRARQANNPRRYREELEKYGMCPKDPDYWWKHDYSEAHPSDVDNTQESPPDHGPESGEIEMRPAPEHDPEGITVRERILP
ncbi:hypothetical protein [Sorangium sp. So ce542]|uniref:hypothetical protein n=1 Tax=Sorangium sp. So ce542 TaxID=3133316 RepID=UPI003F648B39